MTALTELLSHLITEIVRFYNQSILSILTLKSNIKQTKNYKFTTYVHYDTLHLCIWTQYIVMNCPTDNHYTNDYFHKQID